MSENDPITEIWKPVIGWEDHYEVSSFGRIQRIKAIPRTNCRVLHAPLSDTGYAHMNFRDGAGRRERVKVHILVAAAFVGPRPDGYEINHKNGVKSDNRPGNLEYVTKSENGRHCYKMGLRQPVRLLGEKAPFAKLVAAQVREIRERYAKGERPRHIAPAFGITPDYVIELANRKSWKHT